MKLFANLIVLLLLALPQLQAQCLQGNCINGKGTYLYDSGARYVGTFKNGKIHGEGVLYFSNGNKYFGSWQNQYREGKGKMVFTNGDIYRGHFHKSKFNGHGTMNFANGDVYEGEWKDDLQHGQGIYTFADGNRYEGLFAQGKFHGQGTMFYTDGSVFEGSWKNNFKDGQGSYTDADGNTLSGLWLSGKYMDDDQEEADILTAETTAPENALEEKDLRNCNKEKCNNGVGVYTYGDGSKWIGEFKDGFPEGQGTCYYSNGDKYVGYWKRHAPHGDGLMQYANGRVLGAKWQYGHPIGKLESQDDIIAQEHIEQDISDEIKVWAVVVGVARYAHMPVLKYTDDDAYHIYAFLKSPEGGALPDNQIRVLIDEDATRVNILRTMRQTFLKADDNDVVLLYYSGHGLPGYFLPVDFDGFNNKIDHEDVKAIFKESKAKHKLCLADACHSGTLTAMKVAPSELAIQKFYRAFENSGGGTALLLSSKGDEFSLEDGGLRQGVFSHFLIRGLKGEADTNNNKVVTIQELFDFVYAKVTSYTGNAQTPTITGKFDPNMPVAVRR
ncbi:MAG TPA: peptidase C14 caspase catalytic subunit p20 [Phaeodactylibacter sp.]|nr:peptidase C14 caspase catalytic subunit p20 [Phaeodactylibacter sp.]